MSYWLFKNNRQKYKENKTSAKKKNAVRDTRRTKKKYQRGTGKRSRVSSGTWEGFFWK